MRAEKRLARSSLRPLSYIGRKEEYDTFYYTIPIDSLLAVSLLFQGATSPVFCDGMIEQVMKCAVPFTFVKKLSLTLRLCNKDAERV